MTGRTRNQRDIPRCRILASPSVRPPCCITPLSSFRRPHFPPHWQSTESSGEVPSASGSGKDRSKWRDRVDLRVEDDPCLHKGRDLATSQMSEFIHHLRTAVLRDGSILTD